jgi:hypothetical protein
VLNSVAAMDIGKASGVNSTLQRFGGVFGVAVATVVFVGNGHLGTPASFTAGFKPALAVTALFALVAAASALAVSSTRPVPASVSAPLPARRSA